MASEREFCGQSAVAIGDVATYVWRDSYECSCLRQRSACDWEEVLADYSNHADHRERLRAVLEIVPTEASSQSIWSARPFLDGTGHCLLLR
jgi:hypothetical protein